MNDAPDHYPGPDGFPSRMAELIERQAKAFADFFEALPRAPDGGAPFDPRHTWESFAIQGLGPNIEKAEFIRDEERAVAYWGKRRVKQEEALARLLREQEDRRRELRENLEKTGWKPAGSVLRWLGLVDEEKGAPCGEG